MNIYTTELQETFGDFNQGLKEVFILPSTIPIENATYLLNRIRNKTWGNWKRLDRKVISVEPLTSINQIKSDWRLKFISTSLEQDLDQIFIFSNTVDHDTMYEIITNFEEASEGDSTGLRFKLGAGFTNLKKCWGESLTLNITCRDPKDTELLLSFMPS